MGVTNCRSSAYSVDTEFLNGKQCRVLLAAGALAGKVERPVKGEAGRIAGWRLLLLGRLCVLVKLSLVLIQHLAQAFAAIFGVGQRCG